MKIDRIRFRPPRRKPVTKEAFSEATPVRSSTRSLENTGNHRETHCKSIVINDSISQRPTASIVD